MPFKSCQWSRTICADTLQYFTPGNLSETLICFQTETEWNLIVTANNEQWSTLLIICVEVQKRPKLINPQTFINYSKGYCSCIRFYKTSTRWSTNGSVAGDEADVLASQCILPLLKTLSFHFSTGRKMNISWLEVSELISSLRFVWCQNTREKLRWAKKMMLDVSSLSGMFQINPPVSK